MPSTSPPIIKLSFKENPSLSPSSTPVYIYIYIYMTAFAVQTHHHHHHHHHQDNVPGSSLACLCPATPITLDLFHTNLLSSSPVELEEPLPLLLGFQNFHNLKTGEIYYKNNKPKRLYLEAAKDTKMSRRNGNAPKLDLKLNLSPPRANPFAVSPTRSVTVSPTSPPSSCVSSDDNPLYSSSPEATSMVLVGCPRCLMYVMLSEDDPKCPKCKSTVLLDFMHDTTTPGTSKKSRKS